MAADLTDADYWETAILHSAGRFFMLAAIADRPGHGYEIARRISEFCNGCCNPSDAMIYPAIKDLEAAGLIACTVDTSSARKRNVCRLTTKGRLALSVAAETWARHLPALGSVVAAARENAAPGAVTLDAGCCPTCSGSPATEPAMGIAGSKE